MTARRAAASIALTIAAVAALTGCSDPQPTADDYLATHVEFWTIAAQVAQEDTGQAPRDDMESALKAQWDDPDTRARLTAIYDGVCEDLKDGGKPDFILDLVSELRKNVSAEAARTGTMKQVDAVVKHLCPGQAGAADAIRDTVLKS